MSTYDPTDLKGQEDSKAEQANRDRLVTEAEDGDWKWLMGRPRGRRIVHRLLTQAGVFRLSFNTNAMTMAFNEGNRNYGNQLLDKILALSPEQFIEMLKESKNVRDSDGNGKNSN